MNLVVVSKVAGVEPTVGNLKEGQLGVNTADGKLFVNDGSKIKTVGGSVWNPTSANERITLGLAREDAGNGVWVTVADLIGPLLVTKAGITADPQSPALNCEVRATKDGVLLPSKVLTSRTTGSVVGVDVIGLFGDNNTNTSTTLLSGGHVYCEESFKLEIRLISGGVPTNTVDLADGILEFAYGTME